MTFIQFITGIFILAFIVRNGEDLNKGLSFKDLDNSSDILTFIVGMIGFLGILAVLALLGSLLPN